LKGVLIDGAHGVIDKVGAQKQSQQEDAGVVVLVLIEGANALGIHNEHLVGRLP